jgi:hypothetical protein
MTQWVDCKERLPTPGEYVLTYCNDGGDYLDRYIIASVTDENIWNDNDYYDVSGITHWQPLPEPPNTCSHNVIQGKYLLCTICGAVELADDCPHNKVFTFAENTTTPQVKCMRCHQVISESST